MTGLEDMRTTSEPNLASSVSYWSRCFGISQKNSKAEVALLVYAGFWPTTGDYAAELDKCERILRTFCVEGLPVEEEITADPSNSAAPKKKRKVYRKVPPKIIQVSC